MNHRNGFYDNSVTYEHKSEFIVESLINSEVVGISNGHIGQLVRRSRDRYGPDLNVWGFNFETLERRNLICKVEVECKVKDAFEEYPDPPHRWYRWSFLGRKVDNDTFGPEDVYLLCNKWPHKRCFWATFASIRTNCTKDIRIPDDRREVYWETPVQQGHFIKYGYDTLAKYLLDAGEFFGI